MATGRLLLVEDSRGDALLYKALLAKAQGAHGGGGDGEPITVDHCGTLADALLYLAAQRPDCVFLDLGLPDAEGSDGVRRLCSAHPDIPVIVITARDDDDLGEEVIIAGAEDYLLKSEAKGKLLMRALRNAVARHKRLVARRA